MLCYFSENFPNSEPHALKAVGKIRLKRSESGPVAETWTMEDHLTALSARIKPLKVLGVDLLDAGIHTFHALRPDVESPTSLPVTPQNLLNEIKQSS